MEQTKVPILKKENKFKNLLENFSSYLTAPSQLLLINIINTPFERFQILNQLKPQLKNFGIQYKNNRILLREMMTESKISLFKGTRIGFYTNLFNYYLSSRVFFKWKKKFSKILEDDKSKSMTLINGVSSLFTTLIISSIVHPLNVAKLKLMAEVSPIKKNIYKRCFGTLDEIRYNEGFKGLYRGFLFGMLKNSIEIGLNFFILEEFEDKIQKNKIIGYGSLAAINGILLYPLDTIL